TGSRVSLAAVGMSVDKPYQSTWYDKVRFWETLRGDRKMALVFAADDTDCTDFFTFRVNP
ncbi:MAG TPA: hypothetical protein PLH19_06660, partial [Anaerolineae bacterium]|nr:hypothetical protein [Anaerolineae bacterium]HQH38202.1 hypothetical protein [Anaerolineae bacterium]